MHVNQWIALVLMVFAIQSHAHKAEIDDPEMFDLMNFTKLNQVKLDAYEAIEESELVIEGVIDKVSPGRDLFIEGRLSGRPISMSLFKVRVTSVLKGEVEPGDHVYFEWITGGISAYELDAKKYPGEMLLFLRDTTWTEDNYPRIENRADGLMHEVDRLYELTTPRALFVEDKKNGKLVSPLSARQTEPLFPSSSLDDLKTYFDGSSNAFGGLKLPQGPAQ